MALKISGTTVVSDARALWNIAAVDTTTVTTLQNAGLGGGSGLFNTKISSATGYDITTSLANAYVASSTSGKTYIVHSIHISNVSGTASANITGQLLGTTYSNITFANNIPVPAGSAVELLKKPKVLQPNDAIQLQASANSSLHGTITIEDVTETKLFGSGVDITVGDTYVDLYTATANSVIESVLLSNDDPTLDVKGTVVWTDGSNNILGYYCLSLIVPNDATVEVLEQPKFLQNGYKVRVKSNQGNRMEALIAGKTV